MELEPTANGVDLAAKRMAPGSAAAPSDVVRVPRALAARLSKLAEAAQRRTSLTIPYPVVVRSVLERGLDELERELGVRRAPRAKASVDDAATSSGPGEPNEPSSGGDAPDLSHDNNDVS
ncbi:MAG: hypothetical protein ABSC94_31550 [Polyangiaceae bacterium]